VCAFTVIVTVPPQATINTPVPASPVSSKLRLPKNAVETLVSVVKF